MCLICTICTIFYHWWVNCYFLPEERCHLSGVLRYLLFATAISAACPACTVMRGNANAGTYIYASIGGDAHGFAQTANSVTAESMTTSPSFQEINKTARLGIGVAGAVGITKDLSSSWRTVSNTKTAASVSNTAAAEATKQAGIAADVTKSTFVPP